MNLRFLSSFIAALMLSIAALADADSRVHPGVHHALRKQGTVNLIVTLAATTEAAVKSVHEVAFTARTAKIDALKTKLQEQAKAEAAPIEALLHQEQDGLYAGFQTFWISNQVFIKAASFALVEKLARLSSVGTIEEEDVVYLALPYSSPFAKTMTMLATATTRQTAELELTGYEWGVSKIGAPQVWSSGATGQGIVVASIGSGVRSNHKALKRNFQFPYLWYDPESKSAEPYDVNGHGTHTMALIAGAEGVGVAPGAKWLACKGCRAEGCREPDLLACAQFVMCPTDPHENNVDCSQAPRVVSNSWSGPSGDDWFQPVIDAWVAADIIPVFSLGNIGESLWHRALTRRLLERHRRRRHDTFR
uniref:subtilisin n=1 Tax=Globisporangium ultimum (strain ATCC 200006 / CBS 805.95 / DAOM BR144) TaxID=431595 RepID=K3WRQ1_GLOUD